jgi:hypothetical protein
MCECLVRLYKPGGGLVVQQTTYPKTLYIPVQTAADLKKVEIDALEVLAPWVGGLMHNNLDLDDLQTSCKVEEHLLLLLACNILRFGAVQNVIKRIKHALIVEPLDGVDVQMLWYVFGDSDENVDGIAYNMAKYDRGRSGDMVWWFFYDEVLPISPEQAGRVYQRKNTS